MVPRVEKGALGAGGPWGAIVLVPGRRPIEALGQALAPTLGRSEVDVVAQLTASPPWLAAELRAARSRVLLVINQTRGGLDDRPRGGS